MLERIDGIVIPELNGMQPTVSLGAAIVVQGAKTNFDEVYRKADECVYNSKNCLDVNTTVCTVIASE